MSPSRPRGQYVPLRPRSEVYVAIATAAGIVLGTLLLIWLMRPGAAGVEGTGGLFTRQPRLTLLVIATLLAIGGVIWYVLTHRKQRRFGEWGTIAIASGVVVVIAVLVGVFWPGGVVKHYESTSIVPQTPTTTPVTTPTTAPSPTTKAPPTTVAPPTTKAR